MKHSLAVAFLGVALSSSAAYANHIDFLDDGAFSITDQGGGGPTIQTVTGIDPGSTLGGQREVRVLADGNASTTATATLGPVFGAGADDDALTYTTSTNGLLQVRYGDFFSPGAPDLNANFLDIPGMAADWDRVRLDFGAGSAPASVFVQLYSRENGGMLGITKSFLGGDSNLDFLHTDFGPNATPEFLRNIDAARFVITAPDAGNYVIESFNRNGFVPDNTDVPTPGGLGLFELGLGLLGFSAFRRRAQG